MIEDEKPRCQLVMLEDKYLPRITVTTNPAGTLLIKPNSILLLLSPHYIKLTQMIRTLITTFALIGLPAVSVAFSTKLHQIVVRRPAAATTTLYYHPDVFEKAVDCAQNYGLCDVDELLNLAKGECCFVLCSLQVIYPSTLACKLTH